MCIWSSYNFFKLDQAGEQTWYLFVVLFIFSNITAKLSVAPLVPKFGNHFWFYNGGAVSSPNILAKSMGCIKIS